MINKRLGRDSSSLEYTKETLKKCIIRGLNRQIARDCWYNESNKSERPDLFPKKMEKNIKEAAVAEIDFNV
jgi:hypothetical protein